MKVLFLGTGAAEGYPALFCNCDHCQQARALGGPNLRCRSSVLVNDDMLVDFGPDTPAQCIRFGVDLTTVRDVLFTHSHSDHLHVHDTWHRHVGSRQKGTLATTTAWGNQASIDAFLDQVCTSVGENFGSGNALMRPTRDEVVDDLEPLLSLRTRVIAPHQSITIGRYTVHTIHAHHKEPEDAMNFIIDDGKRRFLYGTDTGPWAASEWAFIESHGITLDLVALDCTVGTNMAGGHNSNESFLEAHGEFVRRGLLSPDHHFLAHHFSHQNNFVHDELVPLVAPHGIGVSRDGLVVEL